MNSTSTLTLPCGQTYLDTALSLRGRQTIDDILNGTTRAPKRIKDAQTTMNVGVVVNEDGSVEVFVPAGTPPDAVAHERAWVKQIEKKTKMIARLRNKLAKRNADKV